MPDIQAAKAEAILGIRSLVSDLARDGRIPVSERVEIDDEGGSLVARIPFGEALKLE